MHTIEIKSTHHASLSFFLGYLMRGTGRRSCERWARRNRFPLWNCDSSQRIVSRAFPISLFSSSSAETTEHPRTYKHTVPIILLCDTYQHKNQYKKIPGGKEQPACKADNPSAICEPILWTMWDPRHLTNPQVAGTALLFLCCIHCV
jgi:hypothetical protein